MVVPCAWKQWKTNSLGRITPVMRNVLVNYDTKHNSCDKKWGNIAGMEQNIGLKVRTPGLWISQLPSIRDNKHHLNGLWIPPDLWLLTRGELRWRPADGSQAGAAVIEMAAQSASWWMRLTLEAWPIKEASSLNPLAGWTTGREWNFPSLTSRFKLLITPFFFIIIIVPDSSMKKKSHTKKKKTGR